MDRRPQREDQLHLVCPAWNEVRPGHGRTEARSLGPDPGDLLQALASREKLGLSGKATFVRQASTARENVVEDISKLEAEDLDYFSLLIIRR